MEKIWYTNRKQYKFLHAIRSGVMGKLEELIDALKAVELESVKEELMSMTKLNELLKKEEEKKKPCKLVWVLAIIGAIVAIAAIAYAVYRYFAPDYYDDFEDDEFEDEFEDDFFEEDVVEPVAEEATAE